MAIVCWHYCSIFWKFKSLLGYSILILDNGCCFFFHEFYVISGQSQQFESSMKTTCLMMEVV